MTTDTVPRDAVPAGVVQQNGSADRSVSELLSRASQEVSQLIRDELKLARVGMTEKGRRLGFGGGLFGAAGLAALVAAQSLVAAAIAGLATVLPVWSAALIVGGALVVAAALAVLAGQRQVRKSAPLMPEQTVESLKADVAEIKKDVHR